MLSRQDAAEAQALSEVWRGMDAAAVAQLKADNDALLQRQQTQETPEQLACIPSLQVPCVCVCVGVCVWVGLMPSGVLRPVLSCFVESCCVVSC
jgi:hypothetical protein